VAKILLVTYPIKPPWNEGSKNTAWQIANKAKRHHFFLLTTEGEVNLPEKDSIKWQTIYPENSSRKRQQLHLISFLIFNTLDADIYHFLFVPTLLTSLFLNLIVRIKRKKSVQTVPSLYKHTFLAKEATRLFFADKIVTLSHLTTEKLHQVGIQQVVNINSGIDLERFSDTTDKKIFRRKLNLPKEKVLALFSGELSRLGSLDFMLSLAKKVIESDNCVHIIFASPTRLPQDVIARKNAQEYLQKTGQAKSVTFLGDVDDFSDVLKASDIFLFPVSRMRGKIDTPLTLLEAMACELPVIVTDISPLNELVSSTTGIVSPLGDVDRFADALLNLAHDGKLRTKLGRAGRALVGERYNVNKMVCDYEALYDELV